MSDELVSFTVTEVENTETGQVMGLPVLYVHNPLMPLGVIIPPDSLLEIRRQLDETIRAAGVVEDPGATEVRLIQSILGAGSKTADLHLFSNQDAERDAKPYGAILYWDGDTDANEDVIRSGDRFTGPSLRMVLAKVMNQYGDELAITAAEKRRIAEDGESL